MGPIRILCSLGVALFASVGGAINSPAGSAQKEIAPLTVISVSQLRWAGSVGLRVVVRDVNQPERAISEARVVVGRAGVEAGTPLAATTDSTGAAALVAPDSGEYQVRILRIGFHPLEFRVKLELECSHVLEAYISSPDPIIDRVYTAGKRPKRTLRLDQTTGRAVLTTCPPVV
jgi:hypothetical protein